MLVYAKTKRKHASLFFTSFMWFTFVRSFYADANRPVLDLLDQISTAKCPPQSD